jgi:hypothetical protein
MSHNREDAIRSIYSLLVEFEDRASDHLSLVQWAISVKKQVVCMLVHCTSFSWTTLSQYRQMFCKHYLKIVQAHLRIVLQLMALVIGQPAVAGKMVTTLKCCMSKHRRIQDRRWMC